MDKVTSTTHNLNINSTEAPGVQQAQDNSNPAMPVMKEKKSARTSHQHSLEHHETHQGNSESSSEISKTEIKKNINADINHIGSMPTEIKWEIFRRVIDEGDFSAETAKSLLSFTESSKASQEDVKNFLNHDSVGSVLGKHFKNNQMKAWNTKANDLLNNATTLRTCWVQSCEEFLTTLALKNEGNSEIFLSQSLGVEIPFASLENYSTTAADITKKIGAGTVIKFNAQGIGRERVLAEVIPALYDATPDCPMIVNLSGNNLTAEDLKPLIVFMADHPAIYQLDLSNNLFCIDDHPSQELEELFSVLGPVSHLYLNNTGLNDSTTAAVEGHIKNSCLMHLDLRLNQLSENGCMSILNAIASTATPTEDLPTEAIYNFIHPYLRAVRLQNNNFVADFDLFFQASSINTAMNNAKDKSEEATVENTLERLRDQISNKEKYIKKTIVEIVAPFEQFDNEQNILESRAIEEKL